MFQNSDFGEIWCKLDNSKLGSTQQQKICWHWHDARIISSQKIYGLYARKPHIVEMRGGVTDARRRRTNKQLKIELLTTQPMEAGGWVSQLWLVFSIVRNKISASKVKDHSFRVFSQCNCHHSHNFPHCRHWFRCPHCPQCPQCQYCLIIFHRIFLIQAFVETLDPFSLVRPILKCFHLPTLTLIAT